MHYAKISRFTVSLISNVSLFTGPPSTHSPNEEELENNEDLLPKKMRLEQNHDPFEDLHNGEEEYGFTLAGHEDSDEEEQHNIEASGKYDSLEPHPLQDAHNNYFHGPEGHPPNEFVTETPPPPPVPPRSHSLSPSDSQNSIPDMNYGGRMDIYGESSEWNSGINNGTARPFLGQGRGGETSAPPPLPVNHMDARSTVTTVATPMSPDEDTPPPIPVKQGRRKQPAASPPSRDLQDIKEEEQALISILDELERSVTNRQESVPVINRMAAQVGAGIGSGEKL